LLFAHPTHTPHTHHTIDTQFWPCVLAWLFYAYIVQGRTAAALERVVRERIVWYWLAAVAAAAGISAMCFYAPHGSRLHRGEVRRSCLYSSCNCGDLLSKANERKLVKS